MYDRFLPPHDRFHPLPEEEGGEHFRREERPSVHTPPPSRTGAAHELLGGLTGDLSRVLGDLFHGFSLSHLDTGDILLLLIVLFLFLEGEDLDLVIALGLMLLLGLGEEKPLQD